MYDLEFSPKKEEELVTLLKVGIGDFKVLKAEKKMSKTGNPMIELILEVWDCEGNKSNIFDYLILNGHDLSLRKIRHFCYSCGLETKYEEGKLNAIDCENKFGKLQISIQKDKNGQYPDKNSVQDYIFIKKNTNNENPIDDSIPF